MKYELSNSESKIMDILWKQHRWMSAGELRKILEQEGTIWKRQTINTFLVRLKSKGLIIQNSRKYIHAYTKEEFDSLKAKELLDDDYGGSLLNFITALSGNKSIDTEEADKLKDYLEKFLE